MSRSVGVFSSAGIRVVLAACVLGAGCEMQTQDLITSLPTNETYHASALQHDAHVVRTEAGIPHIYAKTRHDAGYVLGFTAARDRFFMMDLARRLGQGTITELLGDNGLQSDMQSRMSGMTYLADGITAAFDTLGDGTWGDYIDAYCAGVNDYIAAVKAGTFEVPTEVGIAGPLLGFANPADMLAPFARRDVAAIAAVTVYQSSFETGDIDRARIAAEYPTAFNGAIDQVYRKAGLDRELTSVIPLFQISSAPAAGTSTGSHGDAQPMLQSATKTIPLAHLPQSLLARTSAAAQQLQVRFRRDKEDGYGSNAWAVAGYATANGHAVAAGDGHLPLSIPSVLVEFGLDTQVFGDGDLHQLGMTIPGLPLMALGTNGKVAWSQTQLGDDVTDWFREIIQLDENGVPAATKWGDTWMPLTRIDEKFKIADVPALGSKGRTVTLPRFMTFDGRWLADYEGHAVKDSEMPAMGAFIVPGLSGNIEPGDEDGDGVITALSFSYAGLNATRFLASTDALGHADSVDSFRTATKGLVAYSQNFAVADASGNILYTSYEPIPCRSNLPRNPDGTFPTGADPTQILDGTKYGGWSIPLAGDIVDESMTDASKCVVPFDKIPMSINPDQGFVATANNDPGGFSFDGNIFNDPVYIGGPWEEGYRVSTISRSLAKEISENRAGVEGMAEVQGNIDSRVGELFTPYLLQAIAHAKSGGPSAADQRLAAIYADDAAAFDEVSARLTRWGMHGYQARSGIETFYKTPTDIEIDDAPSTMIFNAWMRVFFKRVYSDEPIQDILGNMGQEKEVRVLYQLVVARGDAGQNALGSWEPTRKESVYFDDVTTPDVVETCDEEMMLALEDALAGLRSPSTQPDVGGFGTADMSKWMWGLRHQVTFLSLIAKYLPSSQAKMFSFITDQLQISTAVLPLASPGETIASDDPRANLTWFPRDGDQWSVNASNMGFGGTPTSGFMYGSGPVMRMVFEVSPQGVVGQDVMPGGESGLTDSPNYADQARMWLANKALPMRFTPSEVAANALRHEVFLPSGE